MFVGDTVTLYEVNDTTQLVQQGASIYTRDCYKLFRLNHNGTRVAVVGELGRIQIKRTDTMDDIWTEDYRFVGSVDFSYDGALVGCSSSNSLSVHDADRGIELLKFPKTTTLITDLAFHPIISQLAVSTGCREILIGDCAARLWLRVYESSSIMLCSLRYSSYGLNLTFSTSADSTVSMWDTATGAYIRVLEIFDPGCKGSGFRYLSMDVNTDGSLVVGCDGLALRVWDGLTGDVLSTVSVVGAREHALVLLSSSFTDFFLK